ncbi:MAG: endonuclease III [Rhodospirillales bacterium]|nr:endonuclease III [Rhodospirillales bacterium]
MKKKDATELYRRLQAQNPAPKSELDFVNPYTLLVAVVLSAQATDKGVNKATAPLFRKVKTPQAMLKLGLEGLKDYVKSIGLYNAKAANIIELSRLLIERHEGQVPRDRDALQALPGVGRKTANVVLNVAFGEPTMAVDTHVLRLANRTGLASGKTPEEVEAGLLKATPPEFMDHAHHWLILHGRYICKARNPRCGDCIIRDLCGWGEKT